MKKTLLFVLFICFSLSAFSQITVIPQNNYNAQYVSSDNTNHPITHAFDEDPATWWALYNANGYSLPGIVEVDLGSNYDVTGFSYLPNSASPNEKALTYEIYLSADGVNWGVMDAAGEFIWIDGEDVSIKEIYFGAVAVRYVQVKYLTNTNTGDNIHTGELVFYQNDGAATGQENQIITFDPIPFKGTNSPDFDVIATSNSGLPVTFEIVSGPATVNGNTISLTGTPGIVEVKALQVGDSNFYPTEQFQSFEVLDLSTYNPEVYTRLTEDFSIEMESLKSYPIYVNASIDIPEGLLEIQEVNLEIEGNTYTAVEQNGFYYYLWTPPSYGDYTININAVLDNGNTTTLTKNIEVTSDISSQTVASLQDVVIEFGGENSRWYYGTYTLPQFVGAYNNLNASLEVECPNISGGCDDWDRWAHIDVKAPDGNWIQLIRYITPYGVGCNHELDVTDYMSLLQGEIEFRVFIDTWGTGGWQLTLNFDYSQGTPEYAYSGVVEVWDASYSFGNPADLQPVETYNAELSTLVESSHLRVSNTGHGWGSNNTGNAAEFFNATHYIDINGNEEYTQNLWNDCNPNPDGCTGQQGTWQYSRAGWCPGAIAPPDIFDLTNYTGSGIDLDYRFHPTYQDFCHPNNPDCISGSTCSDCNDGYNPVYYVDAHIINKSHNPIVYGEILNTEVVNNEIEYNISVYPNPSNGLFSIYTQNLEGNTRLSIHTIEGRQVKVYYFNSNEELNNYSFNLKGMSSGIYFINIENARGSGTKKIILD